MAQQPLVGRGPLVIEASRSHSDTPHTVELLWTSDQPDARLLHNKTQHSQEADIQTSAEFGPEISESERPQIHTLDHVVTGNGVVGKYFLKSSLEKSN